MDLSAVITAVFTGIIGIYSLWTKFHQDEKNKETDFRLEQQRKEAEFRIEQQRREYEQRLEQAKKKEARNSYQRSRNTSKVLYELHHILFTSKASRVYIVQPHPLKHSAFLSIQFEVTRKEISGMKKSVQSLPMEEVAVFSHELQKNLWMYYDDIDEQVQDKVAKSLLSSNGCVAVGIKQLNSAHDWVGNIFVEFTEHTNIAEDDLRELMHEAAVNIQYNLPEFIDEKDLE